MHYFHYEVNLQFCIAHIIIFHAHLRANTICSRASVSLKRLTTRSKAYTDTFVITVKLAAWKASTFTVSVHNTLSWVLINRAMVTTKHRRFTLCFFNTQQQKTLKFLKNKIKLHNKSQKGKKNDCHLTQKNQKFVKEIFQKKQSRRCYKDLERFY